MIFARCFLYAWLIFYKKQKDTIMNSISISKEFEIVKQVSILSQNKTNGYGRSNEKEEDSISILSKIKKNKEQYNKLQLLQNPHISVIEKLMIIKEMEKDDLNSIDTFQLQKGGLWKDWE